jgi:hypothetical protein
VWEFCHLDSSVWGLSSAVYLPECHTIRPLWKCMENITLSDIIKIIFACINFYPIALSKCLAGVRCLLLNQHSLWVWWAKKGTQMDVVLRKSKNKNTNHASCKKLYDIPLPLQIVNALPWRCLYLIPKFGDQRWAQYELSAASYVTS